MKKIDLQKMIDKYTYEDIEQIDIIFFSKNDKDVKKKIKNIISEENKKKIINKKEQIVHIYYQERSKQKLEEMKKNYTNDMFFSEIKEKINKYVDANTKKMCLSFFDDKEKKETFVLQIK